MTTYYTFSNTPAGEVLLVGNGTTVQGIYWKVFKRLPKIEKDWVLNKNIFKDVIKELSEYFKGTRTSFSFKMEATGTDFQKKVWNELSKIPFGETVSYADIAKAIKKPKAVRAIGTAVGSNPLSIVVPCHRVLSSDRKLAGFAGGLESKMVLLKREGASWKE